MWTQPFIPNYVQAPQPLYYPVYYMPIVPGFTNPYESTYNPMSFTHLQNGSTLPASKELIKHGEIRVQNEKQQVSEQNDSDFELESNKLKSKIHCQSKSLSQKSTNIQKNYAKAIVHFALRQRAEILKALGEKQGIEFLKILSQLKNNIKNINHIKRHTNDEKQLKLFRILASRFLKKEAIGYIYNSNIKSTSHHILYRNIIIQSLLKY